MRCRSTSLCSCSALGSLYGISLALQLMEVSTSAKLISYLPLQDFNLFQSSPQW